MHSQSTTCHFQDKQLELIDVESTDMLDTDDEFIRIPKPHSSNSNTDGQIVDDEQSNDEIDSSVEQVKRRFEYGCECSESCFKHLDPDSVFKHRLNVAELTKEEHDMYLMGLTMACLANRKHTYRNKERQRQRASYVYQGRRVCLDSFLYLENVTQYHLKRIRNHVMVIFRFVLIVSAEFHWIIRFVDTRRYTKSAWEYG